MKFYVFCLTLLIVLINYDLSQAQKKDLEIESYFLNSSSKPNPFWLRSNQYGMFQDTSRSHQLLRISLLKDFNREEDITTAWGISVWGQNTENIELSLEELYFKLGRKNLILSIGKQREASVMNSISSTNGNILFSQNTRPIPAIKLELYDYITAPFTKRFLHFKGYWREGLLNDTRYVDKTMVHNKKIMLKWGRNESFYIETGLEHFVQWGGNSFSQGRYPKSISDYWDVIRGQEGKTFDTHNALGNHIAAYHLNFNFNKEDEVFQFFMQHPFEDRSGREFDNWPDGLYGFYWERRKKSELLNHFVYEFYHTKNQSGPLHNNEFREKLSGDDDYFNNGVYRSGWTYFGQTIGSPFFKPYPKKKFEDDDKSLRNGNSGIENSRFVAHHVGFGGQGDQWSYRTMLSYSMNWGRFQEAYTSRKDQFSFFTELNWQTKKKTYEISGALGFDTGDLYPNGIGGRLRIIRNLNF